MVLGLVSMVVRLGFGNCFEFQLLLSAYLSFDFWGFWVFFTGVGSDIRGLS